MNYVLPLQRTREVKTMALRRGRLVADEVAQQVRLCTRQTLGQSGFLSWTTTEGKSWGVFENGRCQWLLHVDSQRERVCYYRLRGDLEHIELHEPGHDGGTICQKVEQVGQLIHSYEVLRDSQINQIENKVRWWQMQRWIKGVKSCVSMFRGRKAA